MDCCFQQIKNSNCIFMCFSASTSSPDLITFSLPSFLHQMECCGWTHPGNWSDNLVIKNSSQNLYSCSCRNASLPGSDIRLVGLCEHLSTDLPIFETVRPNIFSSSTSVTGETIWKVAASVVLTDVKMKLQREIPASHEHTFHRCRFPDT